MLDLITCNAGIDLVVIIVCSLVNVEGYSACNNIADCRSFTTHFRLYQATLGQT